MEIAERKSFFIDSNGKLWTTGEYRNGATGLGSISSSGGINNLKKIMTGFPVNYQVAKIDASRALTLVVLMNGTIYISGEVDRGIQNHNSSNSYVSTFEPLIIDGDMVENTSGIKLVRILGGGNSHSGIMILTNDNKLYVRGYFTGYQSGYAAQQLNDFKEVNLSILSDEL